MGELLIRAVDDRHRYAQRGDRVEHGDVAVVVEVAVGIGDRARILDIVDPDAVKVRVGHFVLAVDPFEVIHAVFRRLKAEAQPCVAGAGLGLLHIAVDPEVEIVGAGFGGNEVFELQRLAGLHFDNGRQDGFGAADAGIAGLGIIALVVGCGEEGIIARVAEAEPAAFDVQRGGKSGILGDLDADLGGAEYFFTDENGAGDLGGTESDALDRDAAVVALDFRDRFVGGGPDKLEVVRILGLADEVDFGARAEMELDAVLIEAEGGQLNGLGGAEELPCAVNGLRGVGVGGEGIDAAHDGRVRIAVRIVNAVGVDHLGERVGNGRALLHAVPEQLFIEVVADEGDALGIAVNAACACFEQRFAGRAAAALLHALADRHPEHGVGKRLGNVVLDIAAVDPCFIAGVDSPAVLEVLGSDAGVGRQAEIAGLAVLGTVAVVDDDALVDRVLRDRGSGRAGALYHCDAAARRVCDGLGFALVLVGEAGIMAVVGADEENVDVRSAARGFAAAGDDDGGGFDGCGAVVDLVAQTVVIRAVHAADGEQEAVLAEGEAVLVDGCGVQDRTVNGVDDFAAAEAGLERPCLRLIDDDESVIEQLHCFGFVDDAAEFLRECRGGNEGEHHNERKRKSEQFADLHKI